MSIQSIFQDLLGVWTASGNVSIGVIIPSPPAAVHTHSHVVVVGRFAVLPHQASFIIHGVNFTSNSEGILWKLKVGSGFRGRMDSEEI